MAAGTALTEREATSSPAGSARGFGWSTLSNLVLRLGTFLVSFFLARLIAPEQFGVFASP